jgi:Acyltransferase
MQALKSTQRLEADADPCARADQTLTVTEILACPLPRLGPGDRLLLRALALCASRYVVAIDGLQHIRPAQDPFILVANHSTLCESLLVPAMLLLHRAGGRVHFLADWNFRLIPGVGFLYARAEVVTVTRKSAKPRLLNVLKPLYAHPCQRWSAPGRIWPPVVPWGSFPKARSTGIRPSCCVGGAGRRGCRWKPAHRSCPWAFVFATVDRGGRRSGPAPSSCELGRRLVRADHSGDRPRCPQSASGMA